MPQLIFMLLKIDDKGGSASQSWEIKDPAMAEHLWHLASHLGPPHLAATGDEAREAVLSQDEASG